MWPPAPYPPLVLTSLKWPRFNCFLYLSIKKKTCLFYRVENFEFCVLCVQFYLQEIRI